VKELIPTFTWTDAEVSAGTTPDAETPSMIGVGKI
jgi:hypothetical protein